MRGLAMVIGNGGSQTEGHGAGVLRRRVDHDGGAQPGVQIADVTLSGGFRVFVQPLVARAQGVQGVQIGLTGQETRL